MFHNLLNRNLFSGTKKFRVQSETEITNALIDSMIDWHRVNELPRLEKLQRYYVGEHEILNRRGPDDVHKPNNRLVHNWGSIITHQLASFFLGTPISYICSEGNASHLERLQEILLRNEESAHNLALSKTQSVFGRAYEYVYLQGGEIAFAEMPVNECFMIYDNSFTPQPLAGVRYYTVHNWITNSQVRYVDVFTPTHVRTHNMDNSWEVVDETEHFFGRVPLICYENNEQGLGDWETAIHLMDAYNALQSDAVNDMEAFADAYLAISNMMGTEQEDIRNMKNNRVMLLSEGGKAEWLVKNADHATIEQLRARVKEDIFSLSGTLDMSEIGSVANISGSALGYKMLSTESVVANKEQYFKRALLERLEMITTYLNIRGNNFDVNNIEPNFVRNMPMDTVAISDFASKMYGIISHETLLSQLDFVENPAEELERIKVERENSMLHLMNDYEQQA